jgi:hypothetical protein
MDETFLQVLHSHKSVHSDHPMVVRIAGPAHRRIVLFDYIPSRTVDACARSAVDWSGGSVPRQVIDRWARTLRPRLAATGNPSLRVHPTRAHLLPQSLECTLKVTELPSGRALARVAMEDYLGKVFKIERQIKELRVDRERVGCVLTAEEVVQWRRERSAPHRVQTVARCSFPLESLQ